MNPFVSGFDVSEIVPAEQVLEGAKIDERLLPAYIRRVEIRVAREILPTFEVDVGFEIRLPRILYCGLKT